MADKTENILVEFDYNNITVVDPNKVIDETGKILERFVKQEDMVMYANLECTVLPRTKLAVGSANNDAIQTVSVAKINFLQTGSKKFLDNSYTDEITGKDSIQGKGVNQPNQTSISNPKNSDDYYIRQTINSGGKPGSTDNGLLGIVSINITQNTSFLPVIRVELEDVKGRALFEAGDNSPYAAFFNLPYPMFYLTLKGYYGKAIRLPLMLQKFTSRFDTYSGNFKVSLTFYTYKYTMLSEVTMAALQATPHMYKSELQIKTNSGDPSNPLAKVENGFAERGFQKIKEVYSEYKSKGLIPDDFPEITLIQMKDRLENFIKNVMDSFAKQNLDPLTRVEEYQKVLNEYAGNVYLYQGVSWFNKYMDKKNFYVLVDNRTKIYTFKEEYKDIQQQNTAIKELKDYIIRYNDLLAKNETVGKNGYYEVNGKKKETRIPINVNYDMFVVNVSSDDQIDFKETAIQVSGKTNPTQIEIDTLKAQYQKKKIFNSADVTVKDGQPEIKYNYFKFENSTNTLINTNSNVLSQLGVLNSTFMSEIDRMGKDLKVFRQQIEDDLTKALAELLESSDNGIGFVPNIRNVLAVVFANGEAFLRLLDDVHTNAWEQRDNKYRKEAVFNKQIQGASQDTLANGIDGKIPIYPWPQFIVETTGDKGQEKYEIRYPGDSAVISQTKGYLYNVWPEIEFVEEFIKGFVERTKPPANATANFNENVDPLRISVNAIEFPIRNSVFSNKEETKFFFEIYERVLFGSYYSKLSRSNYSLESDKITNSIAESEYINLLTGLGNDNPFLIKKLKEYNYKFNNFETVLKHFSNDGVGLSWQNFIRGIFNTSYIKNIVTNSPFEFYNNNLLFSPTSQTLKALTDENSIVDFITGESKSNVFDFTDTYPYIDDSWVKTGLAYGSSVNNALSSFGTSKVLNFNLNKKVVTNFLETTAKDEKRPITNFVYKKTKVPNIDPNLLKDFYLERTVDKQLVTEGNLYYNNYDGNLGTSAQTTSMLNTPIFINSISQGVKNFRNNELHPYVESAYLFLNSLPIATTREKFKTYQNTQSETENSNEINLDYIFATLKKFGAIHKLPYAWALKIGAVYHRYKKYVETGTDILDTSWTNFKYVDNFDPITQDPTRNYGLIINGSPIDIVLQKDTTIGTEISSLINTGFYPGLVNDFNVFYQGFMIYTTYTDTDIQSGFNSGVTLNYATESFIDEHEGFDPNNLQRDLRVIPWSVMVDTTDTKFSYVMPSQGSLFNQTKNECFKDGKIKIEVNNNKSMYDGSVRLFWAAPQYGYFDLSKITKPTPEEYFKKIILDKERQENFSLGSSYTNISELFSIFEKNILDEFEKKFLDFSKSIYDFKTDGETLSEDEKMFRNFQLMFRNMMKIPKVTGNTGSEVVTKVQNEQTTNIARILSGFLEYDILFRYGNPSGYDRRLFETFSTEGVVDPVEWDSYKSKTPDGVPTLNGNVTLTESQTNYPDAWKALKLYVGFSDIPDLTYKDSGSFITDFFVDYDVAFDVTNIKNLSPIIKLYASQKLKQFQVNPTSPNLPIAPQLPGQVLEIVTLNNGSVITIYKQGPRKLAQMRDSNGVVLFTGEPVFISFNPSNDEIINEAIISRYVFVTTNSNDPQYIVSRTTPPVPEYPKTPSGLSKWGKTKFSSTMDSFIEENKKFQEKIFNSVITKVQKSLPDITTNNDNATSSVLEGPQTKVELWESFKAINDKWISGNDFKTKTLFEDVLLLDRASRNIGDKILVDIFKLKNRLMNINPKTNMLTFVQTILTENNFIVMNIPSYVNFYNVQDVQKNPKPRVEGTLEFANTLFGTFLNVDYRDSSAKMVCFYGGKPSEQLDLKNNVDYRYRNDAFELTRASDNPLSESLIGKNDWDKSNKVVGFNVDIGPQNQSIFYGFNVAQENGQATAESLEVLNQMANQGGNRGGSTQSTSLYNLYKNRSYTCTLSMMGNVMIQPTMYFNLRHVPMFSGPYMITSVSHSISPGNFETIIEGIRQPVASLPKIDAYLQTLKTNLLQSIVEENKRNQQVVSASSTQTNTNTLTNNANTSTDANSNGSNTVTATQTCTAATQYSDYTIVTPTKNSLSINDMVRYINTTIQGQPKPDLLKYYIFAWVYIGSGSETGFVANGNNFGGIQIDQYWGESGNQAFTKNYFCSEKNIPYVIFSDPEKHIQFLVSRWASKVSIQTTSTAIDIATFWAKYYRAEQPKPDELNNLTQVAIDLQPKVQKSIDLYNQTMGNNQPASTSTPPTQIIFGVTTTVNMEPTFVISINDPSGGLWKIIIAEERQIEPSECLESVGTNLSNYIVENGNKVQISIEDILFEGNQDSGCPVNGAKYEFSCVLQPVLSNGDVDSSRTQIFQKVYTTI